MAVRSKPHGGPIVKVMKCEACEEFKLGGIGLRTWAEAGIQRFNF